ncbi:MAG TPA: FAD-dependent oxidoreductase [Solirubrobacterales bacterium]|jgi:choline dehydrogenase-like flavoprotein|nr:FAD-dependent oxidoreductase [Solirubrobacterales bacterium]
MGSGEAAGIVLSDSQRAVLTAVCDTVVPSLPRERDAQGLWGRKASDLGVDLGAATLISEIPDPELRGGLLQLIDALGGQGITRAPSQESREQILRNTALSDPRAAAGVAALIGMTLFLNYGAPDPQTGKNPNWEAFRYPGPISAPPKIEKPLKIHEPEGSDETIEADVCIVGSGSGGAVVAAVLAERGLDVVVLEAAGYYNESDFNQLELPAYQQMFWRGGPTPTADGNVSLVAGTTLGGGTTINWTNCLRTRPWVREQWAEHGLGDVGESAYDRHLDTVLERLSANDQCSELNGTQQRLREGTEALGWSFETIVRNTDQEKYSPETAAYLGFGDQSGSKQSADRTWLADAQEHGARFLTFTRAMRIITDAGRAAGVEAVWETPDGRGAQVTVRAPRVVVACGSLESPALLLRSDIGGPAAGQNLRLHPSSVVGGAYGADQEAWWGAPQAGLCDEFADTGEGYGFLIETAQYAPGLIGSATPWISAADHKQRMEDFRFTANFISLTRDRGAGQVGVDANGESLPMYAITDPLDLENLKKGIEVQIRLHEAAGAHQIGPLAEGAPTWRRGDDLEAFMAAAKRIPFRAGGYKLFSAHQMGSCRMGEDPQTSVAGPWGELHDTRGVWVGDASAFPTSSGTNPMVSIMALAHRTAEAIAEDAGAAAAESAEAQPA